MKNYPQYEPLVTLEDKQAVRDYITGDVWLTEFKETRAFEKSIADFLGVKYCSVVVNGTISLSLALLAGGIKTGDKVIVPNLTMIATATAVSLIGAIPVFVDVTYEDLTLNPSEVLKVLEQEKDIKALIYVSLNGRAPHLYTFKDICEQHRLLYVGDDAQSLGSCTHKGEKIGSIATISSFSFSMPKIITTGQGGCLVTNNERLHKKILELRDFGREKTGVDSHPYYGINCKFTDLQASIGNSQMKTLPERIKKKIEIYELYRSFLKDCEFVKFISTDLDYVTPWFVDVRLIYRKGLVSFLEEFKINTRPMYPSITTQGIYSTYNKYLPNSFQASQEVLWLPSSMTLEKEDIEFICNKIKLYYKTVRG